MKNKTVNPINGETTDYKNLVDSKTQEKINKHMNDIDDKITEEDLKNIRTDMYDELLRNENEEITEAGKNELTEEEKDKEKEKDESQKVNSAWNILEEG